jgi:hypothetical protein
MTAHDALVALLGETEAARFNIDELDSLEAGSYSEKQDLMQASREGLIACHLRPGRIDAIMARVHAIQGEMHQFLNTLSLSPFCLVLSALSYRPVHFHPSTIPCVAPWLPSPCPLVLLRLLMLTPCLILLCAPPSMCRLIPRLPCNPSSPPSTPTRQTQTHHARTPSSTLTTAAPGECRDRGGHGV